MAINIKILFNLSNMRYHDATMYTKLGVLIGLTGFAGLKKNSEVST